MNTARALVTKHLPPTPNPAPTGSPTSTTALAPVLDVTGESGTNDGLDWLSAVNVTFGDGSSAVVAAGESARTASLTPPAGVTVTRELEETLSAMRQDHAMGHDLCIVGDKVGRWRVCVCVCVCVCV